MQKPNITTIKKLLDYEPIIVPPELDTELKEILLSIRNPIVDKLKAEFKEIAKKALKEGLTEDSEVGFTLYPKTAEYRNNLWEDKIGGISSHFFPKVKSLLKKLSEEDVLKELRKIYPKNLKGEYLYFIGDFKTEHILQLNNDLSETHKGDNTGFTYTHVMLKETGYSLVQNISVFSEISNDYNTWKPDAYYFLNWNSEIEKEVDESISSKYFTIMEKFMKEVYASWTSDRNTFPDPATFKYIITEYKPAIDMEFPIPDMDDCTESGQLFSDDLNDYETAFNFFGLAKSQQEPMEYDCMIDFTGTNRKMMPFIFLFCEDADYSHQFYGDILGASSSHGAYFPLKDDGSCT